MSVKEPPSKDGCDFLWHCLIINIAYFSSKYRLPLEPFCLTYTPRGLLFIKKLAQFDNDLNAFQYNTPAFHFIVPNFTGLEIAMDEFTTKLTRYDVGLFYFSGHGMAFQGENYLMPIDANLSFENQARSQCVSLRRILDGIEGAQPKISLVLLDACRNKSLRHLRPQGWIQQRNGWHWI